MRRLILGLAVFTMLLLPTSPVPRAQGTLPPMGGVSGPAPLGQDRVAPVPAPMPAPMSAPMPAPMPAPAVPPGPSADGGSPGFDAPAPPPRPAQPARPNYADELTDFGVPPQDTPRTEVGAPTPTSIPGAHVITTDLVRQVQTQNLQVLLVDVLAGAPGHPSIPGAQQWPGAGSGGTFNDALQTQLWDALSKVTNRSRTYPLIFLCEGSKCWESYNAALRAAKMGFTQVMWYRGGLESWHAAGLPMTGGSVDTPQNAPASGPGPGFGFGSGFGAP